MEESKKHEANDKKYSLKEMLSMNSEEQQVRNTMTSALI